MKATAGENNAQSFLELNHWHFSKFLSMSQTLQKKGKKAERRQNGILRSREALINKFVIKLFI